MLSLAVYETYTPEEERPKMEQVLLMCQRNMAAGASTTQADPLGKALVVSSRELSGVEGKSKKPGKPKKPPWLSRGRGKRTRLNTRGRGGRRGRRGDRVKNERPKPKLRHGKHQEVGQMMRSLKGPT